MDIAARVKDKRMALGLTQLQLAKLVGVGQNSIQKIESGETKNPRNIESLARILKCSPEFLRFGVGEMDNASLGPEPKRSLPLISYVQAGTWNDINGIKEPGESYDTKLICPVNCSESSFVLKVQGASMENKFSDGDLIFIDPEAEYSNGSFVVARLEDDNQATFKQLIIDGSQKFLKAINPDWPVQFVPINGNCTIVGKVIFAGKEF